jgi:hypothetical protein
MLYVRAKHFMIQPEKETVKSLTDGQPGGTNLPILQ